MVNNANTRTHAACPAPSCNMNFYLSGSLAGASQEKFTASVVLLMERVNSPGFCAPLCTSVAPWKDVRQFLKEKYSHGQNRWSALVKAAQFKCVYPCMREVIAFFILFPCSLILFVFVSLLSTLYLLQGSTWFHFLCIPGYFPFPGTVIPPPPPHPQSSAAMHGSQ